MKTYTEMVKSELLECIEMASEDAHSDARRKRWTKAQMVEWLEGFAEHTDVAPSVAQEPEPAETAQTDPVETAPAEDGLMSFEFNGTLYERKVSTYARSGRRWARVAKSYVEILDDGSAVLWKD